MEKVNEKKCRDGWGEELRRAQINTDYFIGKRYPRIPHHEEQICGDCAAKKGQLHVPGCDQETCPKCHGQALSCGC